MEITSNIYAVGGSSNSDPSDAYIYLIKSGHEAALVDSGTGEGTERVVKNIKSYGTNLQDIKYLFLTHCHYDHSGGADKLRGYTGCKIVAHELDAVFLEAGDSDVTAATWYGTYMKPLNIDIKINEKHAAFFIGDLLIDFYHTPGHSPGSSILTVKSDDRLVLFGQDVHGPLNDLLRSNREDYNKSLEFMLSLEADILCEGHFGIYTSKEKVQDFIESFL